MKGNDDFSFDHNHNNRRRRLAAGDDQDQSTLDNESAIIWSDNPEQAYFQAMMNKKQGGDSLIGDSTVADMINDCADTLPTYDPHLSGFQGGYHGNNAGSQAEDTLDRILQQPSGPDPTASSSRKSSRSRSWFSKQPQSRRHSKNRPAKGLAESDNREIGQIEILDESMFDLEQMTLPSVIFVNGQPSAITTANNPKAASPSKSSYAAIDGKPPAAAAAESSPPTRRRGTWAQWTIVVLLILVIAAIIMLVLTFTDDRNNDQQIDKLSSGQKVDDSTSPNSVPTIAPAITKVPTVSPTRMPILLTRQPAVLSDQTKGPAVGTDSPSEGISTSPSAASAAPTSKPSQDPTLAPTTSAPTPFPTPFPTPVPSLATLAPVPIIDDFTNRLVALSPNSATALAEFSSPQRRAVEWISTEPDAATMTDTVLAQRWALTSFYMGAEGFQWKDKRRRLDSWLSTDDVCNWFGITCDPSGNVKEVSLKDNDLKGTLPLEIFLLSNLSVLRLDDNEMTGTLPWSELSLLSNLNRLQLSNNFFEGTLPTVIGLLSNLNFLSLARNDNFAGTIPTEIGLLQGIGTLDLSRNNFSGQLPAAIANLISLETLALRANQITGDVPPELGRLSNLEKLSISVNSMVGQIPGLLCDIDGLDLSADCQEIICPCCTRCCIDGEGCFDATPTLAPSDSTSSAPSRGISDQPSDVPTSKPTFEPSQMPTPLPTPKDPSPLPSSVPSLTPTMSPSSVPTGTEAEGSCSDSIAVSKSCYNLQESIVLEFRNCNPLADDWIGLYSPPVNETDLGATGSWVWACGSRTCSAAVTSGQVEFIFSRGEGVQTLVAFIVRRNSGGPYVAYASSEEFVVDATGEICPNSDSSRTSPPTDAPGSIVVSNNEPEDGNATTPFSR